MKVYSLQAIITIIAAVGVSLTFATYYYSVAEVTVVPGIGGGEYVHVTRGFPLGWFLSTGNPTGFVFQEIDGFYFGFDVMFYVLIVSLILLIVTRAQIHSKLDDSSADLTTARRLDFKGAAAIAFYAQGLVFLYLGGLGWLFESWIPTTPQLTSLGFYFVTGIGLIASTVSYSMLSSHRASTPTQP